MSSSDVIPDKEWYESEYNPRLSEITTIEEMEHLWFVKQHRYMGRLARWFSNTKIYGNVLEMGFNDCKTIAFLLDNYEHIEVDAFDWNESTRPFTEAFKRVHPRMGRFSFCDCSNLPYEDNRFDFVTALDFFEHIEPSKYYKCISEVYRVTKPRGRIFVYFGTSKSDPAHINLKSVSECIKDMEGQKFEFESVKDGMITFRNSK